MRIVLARSLWVLALALLACGGDDTSEGSLDAGVSDLSLTVLDSGAPARDGGATGDAGLPSVCSSMGDHGNSLGVGAWCDQLRDCEITPHAPVCAVLDDPQAHFCTLFCALDGGSDECGEGATCVRGERLGALCVPTACLAGDGGVEDARY